MVKITDIIFDYMQHHRRLTVPGLGSFLKRGEGEEIFFSEFAKGDDGVLWGEMVRRGVAEVVAAVEIESFVERVKEIMDSSDPFFIVGVGALIRNEKGVIVLSRTISRGDDRSSLTQQQPDPDPEPIQSSASSVVEMMRELEDTGSKKEIEIEREIEDKRVVNNEVSRSSKRGKFDPLTLFLIVSIIVAICFFANGFIIGWRIGSITLPPKLDKVMVVIFGDGFDEVEDATQFPIDEVE